MVHRVQSNGTDVSSIAPGVARTRAAWAIVGAIVTSLCSIIEGAAAHDLKGILVQEVDSASPEIATALSMTPTSDAAKRSVLNNLRLWPVPRRITICFVSGDQALRKRVSESMQRSWPIDTLTGGRLVFDTESFSKLADCVTPGSFDIRVDFKSGDGYWSYVGIESLKHNPSMNLGGFTDDFPVQEEFDRLVGHETGHALGLEHEHQSPAAPDCGWNFEYISTHYHWDSTEEMHANFKRLRDYISHNRHAYIFSTYDQKSEMHYDFEPAAFNDGEDSPCFITRNFVPSDQDRNALRVAYGPNLVSDQTRTRDAAPGLVSTFSGPDFQLLRDMVSAKVSLVNLLNQ